MHVMHDGACTNGSSAPGIRSFALKSYDARVLCLVFRLNMDGDHCFAHLLF
jgi:hypothetical protein